MFIGELLQGVSFKKNQRREPAVENNVNIGSERGVKDASNDVKIGSTESIKEEQPFAQSNGTSLSFLFFRAIVECT
jgi:hypothetical protein